MVRQVDLNLGVYRKNALRSSIKEVTFSFDLRLVEMVKKIFGINEIKVNCLERVVFLHQSHFCTSLFGASRNRSITVPPS
jgi:hypothetical protein